MHVLRLLRIFIPLLLFAAVAAAIVLVVTSRSDLQRSRNRVVTEWAPLRSVLDARYGKLAAANTQVQEVPGPLHQIVTQVSAEYTHWRDLVEHDGNVGSEVVAANDLEALGRRLVRAARVAPRLFGNTAALGAVDVFAKLTPPESAKQFNDAVRSFERKRNRPAERLAAQVLGFDAIAAYDSSGTG